MPAVVHSHIGRSKKFLGVVISSLVADSQVMKIVAILPRIGKYSRLECIKSFVLFLFSLLIFEKCCDTSTLHSATTATLSEDLHRGNIR